MSRDVNNTLTINAQSVRTQAEIDIGNTIDYDAKSYQYKRDQLPGDQPIQNDYSKVYKRTHKRIEVYQLTEKDIGMANEYVTQFKNLYMNLTKIRDWHTT